MKKINGLKICLLLVWLVAATPLAPVRALGGLDTTADKAGFVEKDIIKIGGNALNVILSFVGVLFLIMMMAGGWLWMTAAGKATQVELAQKLLVAGIIGVIIVVSAYAITAWVGDSLSARQ